MLASLFLPVAKCPGMEAAKHLIGIETSKGVPNVTTHPSTVSVGYQVHMIRCGTLITCAH